MMTAATMNDVEEDALPNTTEPSSSTRRFRSATDYDTESSLRAALLTDYSADYDREYTDPEDLDTFRCDWQVKLDLSTSTPQSVEDEARRLMELKEYAILGSDHEEKFERITALASRIFQVPICLISLVDIGRQWFMSNRCVSSSVSRIIIICQSIANTHHGSNVILLFLICF
jgi:hypothetical protein